MDLSLSLTVDFSEINWNQVRLRWRRLRSVHSYGVALPTCNENHHVSFMMSHHLVLLGCCQQDLTYFGGWGFPILVTYFVAVCAYLMQISKFKIQTALNTKVFFLLFSLHIGFQCFRPFRFARRQGVKWLVSGGELKDSLMSQY